MNDINKERLPKREMGNRCEQRAHRRKNEHMKRWSVSLISRKIQSKAMYPFLFIRLAKT